MRMKIFIVKVFNIKMDKHHTLVDLYFQKLTSVINCHSSKNKLVEYVKYLFSDPMSKLLQIVISISYRNATSFSHTYCYNIAIFPFRTWPLHVLRRVFNSGFLELGKYPNPIWSVSHNFEIPSWWFFVSFWLQRSSVVDRRVCYSKDEHSISK